MDNREIRSTMLEDDDKVEDSSSSDSSNGDSSNSDSNEAGGLRNQVKNALKGRGKSGGKGNGNGGLAPLRQIQDFNEHSEQLHRHHRGMMQWKVRTRYLSSRPLRLPTHGSHRELVLQSG